MSTNHPFHEFAAHINMGLQDSQVNNHKEAIKNLLTAKRLAEQMNCKHFTKEIIKILFYLEDDQFTKAKICLVTFNNTLTKFSKCLDQEEN